jgi:hypothetical protein
MLSRAKLVAFTIPFTCAAATLAQANVTISAAQTQNISCSGGVCAPRGCA